MTATRRATHEDVPAIIELQRAAYAQNRSLLGVEPLPLQADYEAILATMECWLISTVDMIDGCLILDMRAGDLLIWSVATHPLARGQGIGNALLDLAEKRARETGRTCIRLSTGELLTANVAWYTRRGFAIERIEQMPDRRVVHMRKELGERT